jgi:hypothetical protein
VRQRNTSPSPPRSTLRTSLRLRPVWRVIFLIGIPVAASALMVRLLSWRSRKPSYWMRSAKVSSAGLIIVALSTSRMARIERLTASRKAALAFSIKCQRRRLAQLVARHWSRPGHIRRHGRAKPR